MTRGAPGHRRPRVRISWWWWAASLAGGAVFLIGVVAWLGTLRDPSSGDPWLPVPILVALLGLGGVIGSPLLGWLRQIGASTAATEEHVVNSHGGTIMRDDVDEIKDAVKDTVRRLARVEAAQEQQGKDILGMREEIGQIRRSERDQWEAIEQTGGRARRARLDNEGE
jgi:hypothetical protein